MIEVRDIRKHYGRKKVLDGVSFTANKGGDHLLNRDKWCRENDNHECHHESDTNQKRGNPAGW